MPTKIIKDGAVIDDHWQVVAKDSDAAPEPNAILPLNLWLENQGAKAVWLDSDESPSAIADKLDQLDIVAINFPAFADGRGFSYGRELRETHGFKGEIRAIGEFMRDQLYYLQRCGFNAFALEGFELESALESLDDFSDNYQAAIDQPQPLFRRR